MIKVDLREKSRINQERSGLIDLVAGKVKIPRKLRAVSFEEIMKVTKNRVAKKLVSHW